MNRKREGRGERGRIAMLLIILKGKGWVMGYEVCNPAREVVCVIPWGQSLNTQMQKLPKL